jgi:tetratricopeptide (TPR) repeat protein
MSKKWYVYKASAELELKEGNLPASERLWLAALEEAEECSPGDPRLLVTLESLSEIYFEQNLFLQSAVVARRIFQTYLSILGPNHPDVGTMARNVALIYRGWQRFDKAEEFYQQALACYGNCFDQADERISELKEQLAATREEMKRGPQIAKSRPGRFAKTGKWDAPPT